MKLVILSNIQHYIKGWSGGAKVLGKLLVLRRSLDYSRKNGLLRLQ